MLLFLQDIPFLYVHVMSWEVKAKEARIPVAALQTITFDLGQVPSSLWTPACPAATWLGWAIASVQPLHSLKSTTTQRFQEASHDGAGFSRDPRLSLIKVRVERYCGSDDLLELLQFSHFERWDILYLLKFLSKEISCHALRRKQLNKSEDRKKEGNSSGRNGPQRDSMFMNQTVSFLVAAFLSVMGTLFIEIGMICQNISTHERRRYTDRW